MAVKCPNCGTTFQESKYFKGLINNNYDGIDNVLIPKEIHNDNVERINKENKTKTTLIIILCCKIISSLLQA